MKKKRYRLALKRRREGVTNYYKRKKLVISEKPRFVVRISNKHILVQFIDVNPKGDITLTSTHSNELKKYGWKAAYNNIPAVYLVGYLAALKALKKGISDAVLDIGLRASTKGARVFVTAKAALDAGINIPLGKDILPNEERIKGYHIANYAKILKENNLEIYERQFSQYLKRGLEPEILPKHFEEVLNNIKKSFK